jgi:hypothetical protein
MGSPLNQILAISQQISTVFVNISHQIKHVIETTIDILSLDGQFVLVYCL